MATEYAFICHDCKLLINIGRLSDASDVINVILKEHGDHNFQLGEDSDSIFEYANGYKFKDIYDYQNDKIKEEFVCSDITVMNCGDFIDFYKKHRVPD